MNNPTSIKIFAQEDFDLNDREPENQSEINNVPSQIFNNRQSES